MTAAGAWRKSSRTLEGRLLYKCLNSLRSSRDVAEIPPSRTPQHRRRSVLTGHNHSATNKNKSRNTNGKQKFSANVFIRQFVSFLFLTDGEETARGSSELTANQRNGFFITLKFRKPPGGTKEWKKDIKSSCNVSLL